MSKIVVETLNNNKKNQIRLENCIFLKLINIGSASVFMGFGGGEIEILSGGFQDFYINTGSPINQDMQLRYGSGTVALQITRIIEDNQKRLKQFENE